MTDTSQSDSTSNPPGPLEGIRVLDLTQALAGPYCTMILADLGAETIKIEPPSGDGTRSTPPNVTEDEAYGGYFHSVNRNKKSISLDLKSEDGKKAFKEMVKSADVVVENFRVGTMDRLGLSYEELTEIKPDLVYASIRGFGDPRTNESPYSERPAYDMISQAMGGIMGITGTEESGPMKIGPGVGDIFPAVHAAVGILSAVLYRDRTGEGQYVDVSMVDGVLSLTERIVYQYSITGEIPEPQGTGHPLLFPFDRFKAKDGYIVIAAPGNKHWSALCDHMDKPELTEEYPTGNDRVKHADELRPLINDWTSSHTKNELFDKLADDLPCAPVYNAADIFEDEHFEVRDMLPEVEHADSGETIQIAGNPIKFDKTHSGVRARGPFLGEHTREVLKEAGLSDDEITELVESDVALTKDMTDKMETGGW